MPNDPSLEGAHYLSRGRSWAPAAHAGSGVEEALLPLAPSRFQLRVSTTDRAGNASPALVGGARRLWLRDDTALRYTAGWRTGHGGHWSSTRSAAVTTRVTGGQVGWVTTTGPSRGSAAVSVDGRRVATVDLWSRRTHHRVLTRTLRPSRHTVTITVARRGSLSRGNRVDYDGVVALS